MILSLQAKHGKGSGYESGPLDPSEKPGTFMGGSDLVEHGDGQWKWMALRGNGALVFERVMRPYRLFRGRFAHLPQRNTHN
jgi:hypothetical protein